MSEPRVVSGLLFVAGFLQNSSMGKNKLEALSISPPLDGDWKCLRPPGHHPHAFDFVEADAGRMRYHDAARYRYLTNGIPSRNYFCWRKPVHAPVAGEVIRVGSGQADHQYNNLWNSIGLWYYATYRFKPKEVNGRLDIRPNAGNHVMIRSGQGPIVFLAHLQDQSIRVAEGDQVEPGQLIGLVGNSGNSTMPHLHINLFDQMEDPFNAHVLPFVFDGYERLDQEVSWVKVETSLPEPGTFVRFSATRVGAGTCE